MVRHMKLIVLLASAIQIVCCVTASSQSGKVIQITDKILSESGPERFDAIEGIDDLQLKMEDRISLYVELLNYYIGEATGEVLNEQITAMGDKILPFLIEKKNMPLKLIHMCTRLILARLKQRDTQITHHLIFFTFATRQQRFQTAPQPLL